MTTDDLVAAYCDGRLDAAGVAELGRRVARDPAAADALALACWTDGALERVLARAPEIAGATTSARLRAVERRPPRVRRPIRARAWRWWPLALAAALLLAVGGWLLDGRAAPDAPPAPALAEGAGLRLDGAPRASAPVRGGERIAAGDAPVALRADGLSVTLAADGELTVAMIADPLRGTHLRLDRGALDAVVDGARTPLPVLVETPELRVRVTGTRFRVRHGAAGSTVEVSEGRVDAAAADGVWRPVAAGGSAASRAAPAPAAISLDPVRDVALLQAGTPDPARGLAAAAARTGGDGLLRRLVAFEAPQGATLGTLARHPEVEVVVAAGPDVNMVQVVVVLLEDEGDVFRGNLVGTAAVRAGELQAVRITTWQGLGMSVPLAERPARVRAVIVERVQSAAPFAVGRIAVR